MVVAQSKPDYDATPQPLDRGAAARSPKLARAAVMLVAGFTITFTATLHQQLGFDRVVAAVTLAMLALAHVYAWWARRSRGGEIVSLLLAVVSGGGAVAVLTVDSSAGFAVVIALWALLNGLLEFVGSVTGGRQDATILGGLGILLSISVLLVHRDPVAMIGFFGAYMLIAGVFLGIAAFDARGAAPPGSAAEPHTDDLQESTR